MSWHETVEAYRKTAIVLSVAPDVDEEIDLKFCAKVGLAILLDKPVILLVRPGISVPVGLRAIATCVVATGHDIDHPETQNALHDAFDSIVEAIEVDRP